MLAFFKPSLPLFFILHLYISDLASQGCSGKLLNQVLEHCIVSCLDLKISDESVRTYNNTTACFYHKKKGNVVPSIKKSNCTICKEPISLQSDRVARLKVYVKLFPHTFKKACGKTIAYGTSTPGEPDLAWVQCGPVEPTYKSWMPENAQEVKCILENLPSDIQRVGRVRLPAYKSNCSDEFVLCDWKYSRRLPKNFLPVVKGKSYKENQTETCSVVAFNMSGKIATNITMQEVSCEEANIFFCEVDEYWA